MEQRKPAETPKKPSLGAIASPEVSGVIRQIRVKAGIPGAGQQDATDLSTYADIPWEIRDPSRAEPIPWLSEEAV